MRNFDRQDSLQETLRLVGDLEQTDTRPLPHDELVQLHCLAPHARFAVDVVEQGNYLARGVLGGLATAVPSEVPSAR